MGKLDEVKGGRKRDGLRILLHGPKKIGKTKFAASAPDVIFIEAETEQGSGEYDVKRFPSCKTWTDLLECVDDLASKEHKYKTVAIDTLDAFEALLFEHLCSKNKWSSIEDPGYGKGYVAAQQEWRVLMAKLEKLRGKMDIILIGHTAIKLVVNPEGPDWEQFIPSINNKAAGTLSGWVDVILFAQYETIVKKDGTKKVKGVSTGHRLLHTAPSASYLAGSRFNLPDPISLDWNEFASSFDKLPASAEELVASIYSKLPDLDDGDIKSKALLKLTEAGKDTEKLTKIDNRLSVLLAEQAAKKGGS